MSLKTISFTPFDVEIIHNGASTGRYANRGMVRPVRDGMWSYQNTRPIYCIPGISFKFDIDEGITTAQSAAKKENFTYLLSKTHILWDFGDGTTSQDYRPTHTFSKPGSYRVTVTVFDNEGMPRKNNYDFTLHLSNYCVDRSQWDTSNYREYGVEYATSSMPLPLTLRRMNSWQTPDDNSTLTLYASGSKSLPSTTSTYLSNKYAHFQKLWRFVKTKDDPVPIDYVKIPGQEIRIRSDYNTFIYPEIKNVDEYNNSPAYFNIQIDDNVDADYDTTVIGVSGSDTVYYIDDTTKNYLSRDIEPVFLFAAASGENLSNDTVEKSVDVLPTKVLYHPATQLQISTNGMPSFTLQKNKFIGSLNSINVSAISNESLIIKSDYEQFRLVDGLPSNGNEARISIVNDINNADVKSNVDVSEKLLPLATPGSGNFLFTPNEESQPTAKILAEVYLQDPLYCPLDTRVYALTNLHNGLLHLIEPGFERANLGQIAGADYGAGSTYSTLPDNTLEVNLVDNIDLKTNTVNLSASCFPICVDPKKAVIYIGNESDDTIFKLNRHGDLLNNSFTINIPELICKSGILRTDPRLAFPKDTGNNASRNMQTLDRLLQQGSEDSSLRFEELDVDISSLDDCEKYLFTIDENNSLAPSSIACDGNHDIWVTLIDGVLTVKLHEKEDGFHEVTAIAIPHEISMENTFNREDFNVQHPDNPGEYKWMPSKVACDSKNNIWVSYTNRMNIKLIKYDGSPVVTEDGTTYPMQQLAETTFPSGTQLDDMIVDAGDDIWITNAITSQQSLDPLSNEAQTIHGGVYNISGSTGEVLQYVTSYTKHLSAGDITEHFDKPTSMAFDLEGTLYVSSGSNDVIALDPGTHVAVHRYTVGSDWETTYPVGDRSGYQASGGKVSAIEGIAVNSDNMLMVVNSIDRKIYSFDPQSDTSIPIAEIDLPLPDNHINSHSSHEVKTDPNTGVEYFLPSSQDRYHIVQGSGDWSGMKWIQTYEKITRVKRLLTATADIHVQSILEDDIHKVNEDFDAAENTIGYALQDTINSKENFLNWFFGKILGDNESMPETLGKTVYEKISNFVSNNSDVDTCNVDSLISLANEIGYDIKTYNHTYPGSIKRLIDMFSVNQSRLLGSRDASGNAFDKNGYANNFNHGKNLGDILDPEEYVVRVGEKFIATELYNRNHTLINPMAIPGGEADAIDAVYSEKHGGLISYNLSSYMTPGHDGIPQGMSWGWGLSHPDDESVFLYYEFYEYKDNINYTSTDFSQLEGVIDWNNPLTTVTEAQFDNIDNWNSKDGLMDSIIDRKLRTGLELFKDV